MFCIFEKQQKHIIHEQSLNKRTLSSNFSENRSGTSYIAVPLEIFAVSFPKTSCQVKSSTISNSFWEKKEILELYSLDTLDYFLDCLPDFSSLEELSSAISLSQRLVHPLLSAISHASLRPFFLLYRPFYSRLFYSPFLSSYFLQLVS